MASEQDGNFKYTLEGDADGKMYGARFHRVPLGDLNQREAHYYRLQNLHQSEVRPFIVDEDSKTVLYEAPGRSLQEYLDCLGNPLVKYNLPHLATGPKPHRRNPDGFVLTEKHKELIKVAIDYVTDQHAARRTLSKYKATDLFVSDEGKLKFGSGVKTIPLTFDDRQVNRRVTEDFKHLASIIESTILGRAVRSNRPRDLLHFLNVLKGTTAWTSTQEFRAHLLREHYALMSPQKRDAFYTNLCKSQKWFKRSTVAKHIYYALTNSAITRNWTAKVLPYSPLKSILDHQKYDDVDPNQFRPQLVSFLRNSDHHLLDRRMLFIPIYKKADVSSMLTVTFPEVASSIQFHLACRGVLLKIIYYV